MASWALALGLCAGCDALDPERKPYTPFPVVSGASPNPARSDTEPPPSVEQALAPPSREPLVAPAGTREWLIGGRQLTANEGLTFSSALVGSLSGGGPNDVLAWLVGTPEKPVVGELWLYAEGRPPELITTAPTFLPTGEGCTHGARLTQTGPDSVSLDLKATCTGALLSRAPVRSVSVLAPRRHPAKIIGFQLAEPAPEESFDVEVASRDRDGDGRDDVELTLRASPAAGGEARARFVWLDRSAGLSRDTSEPLAAFNELASAALARAGGRKTSGEVATLVAAARRLYSTACAESGVPRIFLDTGEGLDCGSLQPAFEQLTRARIKAAASEGKVLDGFAALEQHTWFSSGSGPDTQKFLDRELSQLATRVVKRRVIKLVPLQARPRAPDGAPRFSPLSFHADGSLLMLTPEAVVRATPDGRFEWDATDEVDPWDTVLTSPTGERLTGVAFPCERSEVSWLRSRADGAPLPPLPTDLIAPRPGNCRASPSFEPPHVRPVAFGPAGVSAFIGAALVGPQPPTTAPPPGSPLSPNGRFSVVSTRWGLLVSGGAKPALWTFDADSAAPPSQLSDCVVSNNAQAAACIVGGLAYVILPDPKSG